MTSKALEAAMYVALDSERFIKREDVVEIIRAYAENITDEMTAELFTYIEVRLNHLDRRLAIQDVILKGLEP